MYFFDLCADYILQEEGAPGQRSVCAADGDILALETHCGIYIVNALNFCNDKALVGLGGEDLQRLAAFEIERFETLEKLTNARATQMLDKEFDYNTFSIIVKDNKQKSIEILEQELKRLKEN